CVFTGGRRPSCARLAELAGASIATVNPASASRRTCRRSASWGQGAQAKAPSSSWRWRVRTPVVRAPADHRPAPRRGHTHLIRFRLHWGPVSGSHRVTPTFRRHEPGKFSPHNFDRLRRARLNSSRRAAITQPSPYRGVATPRASGGSSRSERPCLRSDGGGPAFLFWGRTGGCCGDGEADDVRRRRLVP